MWPSCLYGPMDLYLEKIREGWEGGIVALLRQKVASPRNRSEGEQADRRASQQIFTKSAVSSEASPAQHQPSLISTRKLTPVELAWFSLFLAWISKFHPWLSDWSPWGMARATKMQEEKMRAWSLRDDYFKIQICTVCNICINKDCFIINDSYKWIKIIIQNVSALANRLIHTYLPR